MAGFMPDTPYFVPRALLPLPYSTEYYVEKLLPNISKWRAESASEMGDKSTTATKFLLDLIPFFVETVVQDGIYFVKEYLEHPISNLLKVR